MLSVLFGLILIVQPGAGALALLFVIGAYAIVYGVIMVIFSFKLKNHSHAQA